MEDPGLLCTVGLSATLGKLTGKVGNTLAKCIMTEHWRSQDDWGSWFLSCQ